MKTDEQGFETEDMTQEGELMDFDEFISGDNSFIKNPEVGQSVEFTVKEIRKMPSKKVAIPGKKPFEVTLSSVDYFYDIITTEDKIYSVTKWQIVGKLKAIGRKLGKLNSVQLKIEHAADGFAAKTKVEAWKVYAMVDGKYKQLGKDSKEWV